MKENTTNTAGVDIAYTAEEQKEQNRATAYSAAQTRLLLRCAK